MNATETPREFITLVQAMRTCQKEYFKTKSHTVLQLSKKYEAMVDKAIRGRTDRAARELQPDLLESGGAR
jgi:hypothetical protein